MKSKSMAGKSVDFSVLMSVYCKEQPMFLRLALASLSRQNLKATEVVIVKDGLLTDGLDAEISVFARAYPGQVRIRALDSNVGLGDALRLGLEWCSFEIVARADSDDINKPHRFQRQIRFLIENPGIGVVGSAIEEFSSIPGDLGQIKTCAVDDADIKGMLRTRNPLNHMSCVFKKSEVAKVGGYLPMFQYEDYYLWYRMARGGIKFGNIAEALVYARSGNDLVGRRRGWKYLKSEIAFFGMMRRDGYISTWQFIANMLPRIVLRLAPKKVLQYFYRTFLRTSQRA